MGSRNYISVNARKFNPESTSVTVIIVVISLIFYLCYQHDVLIFVNCCFNKTQHILFYRILSRLVVMVAKERRITVHAPEPDYQARIRSLTPTSILRQLGTTQS